MITNRQDQSNLQENLGSGLMGFYFACRSTDSPALPLLPAAADHAAALLLGGRAAVGRAGLGREEDRAAGETQDLQSKVFR